jgi:hypothetical protein
MTIYGKKRAEVERELGETDKCEQKADHCSGAEGAHNVHHGAHHGGGVSGSSGVYEKLPALAFKRPILRRSKSCMLPSELPSELPYELPIEHANPAHSPLHSESCAKEASKSPSADIAGFPDWPSSMLDESDMELGCVEVE